jgi:hypothetical protein
VSGDFFFLNNTAGTRITTTSMVDYSAIQKSLTENNLHLFTFYTKADEPAEAVIRHLLGNISAEDITVAFQQVDYDVISVKQMTANVPLQKDGPHRPRSPSASLRQQDIKKPQ